MIKAIITFITKAAPRFIGEMMKNPKNVTKLFKESGEKIAKSEFYSKATDFLGQTPGAWAKECARNAVSQSATNLMMGAITGGFTKLFSGGGGKQYSFPSKTSGNTVGGYKAPGIQTTNAAQASNVRSFNQTSRTLGNEANKQLKIRQQQKKVIDRYRKNIQRKNFSIGEITSLSNRLEKELQRQKTSLLSGLKSGKHSADGLSRIQPPKQIKTPTQIPKEQQPLATYTKEALDEMNKQMQENIKAVNENISKSIASMNRKEEEIAQKMMANLGNYNTVAYKKLADTMTKTEEVSFQKQQESAYYQTDMLADKLDNDHDYSSKQLGVLRSEVLGNTQTMYELDKQNRMIEENYRALEEKKNNGFTVGTIGALLTQTYQMVQNSLKTPDIINDNVNNAMKSVAFTAGEEVGKLIQMFKELVNGFRAALRGLYMKIPSPLNKTLAPFIGMLDWVNDRVFRGLLGADDSVVEDVFGTPGTLADLDDQKHTNDYGDDEGAPSKAEVTDGGGFIANSEGHIRGNASGVNLKGYNKIDLVDAGNFNITGDKVEIMTNSGYSTTLKHDQKKNESDKEYKARKLREAIEEQVEDFGYEAQSSSARDTKKEAQNRLKNALLFIENTKLTRSGGETTSSGVVAWDADYVLSGNEQGESHPPAVLLANRDSVDKNSWATTNCKDFIEDKRFQGVWQSTELRLIGEMKLRVGKLLEMAASKGIKYRITSMLRVPSLHRTYLSEHNMGLAIDISVDMVKERNQSMTSLLAQYSQVMQGKPTSSNGVYMSTALSWSDLQNIVKDPQNYLLPNTPDDIYDLFSQWYEFLAMCNPQGLTFGSTGYKQAYTFMGRAQDVKDPVDLVHICLATGRNKLDSWEVNNKEKLKAKEIDASLGGWFRNNTGRQNDALAKVGDSELESVISDIVGTDTEFGVKETTNNKIYYTDDQGNVIKNAKNDIYANMRGDGYSYKDYEKNEEGQIVERKKDDVAKQIKTDRGMMLYDRVKSGQVTAEEMRKLKEALDEWDKQDASTRGKSDKNLEVADNKVIVNNYFNNTTVVDNKSDMSTGNESNIPQ